MAEGDSAELYVRVVCPTCHARLHPRRDLLGKRVRCPDCGVAVRVEETKESLAVAQSAAAEAVDEYRLTDDSQPTAMPETVLVVCGTCGARLFPRTSLVGKRIRCPDCFKPVLVTATRVEAPRAAPPPAGEYRLDAEPAAERFAGLVTVAPPDKPLFESEPLPPPSPALWYFTGIYSFPWYPDTVSRWMVLTLLSLFANGVAVYIYGLMAEMAAVNNALAGYGVGMQVAGMIAMGAISGLLMVGYAAGAVVTIVRETASGNDAVTDWSDTEIYEGMWRILNIVFPLAASAALGYAAYFLVLRATGDSSTGQSIAPVVGASISAILFPVMLVSVLEQGAFWIVVSPLALRLIFGFLPGWLLVNVQAAIVTGAWWGLTAVGVQWAPWLTVIIGAPLYAAVIMIDARLLGRFLYRASEIDHERAAAAEEEDDDVDE